MNTHRTGNVPQEELEKAVNQLVDLSPRGIRTMLKLNKPIYTPTSSYGHFGRTPTNEGHFSWEKLDLVEKLQNIIG